MGLLALVHNLKRMTTMGQNRGVPSSFFVLRLHVSLEEIPDIVWQLLCIQSMDNFNTAAMVDQTILPVNNYFSSIIWLHTFTM